MTPLHPARSVLMLAMLGILSGCATGSSLSIARAPLSFVLTDDGSYEIAAQQDGTAQALAERGDIEHGVPGYDVLGGNALLPVSAVAPIPALTSVSGVGALGPSLVSVAAVPGQAAVSADVVGQVKVAVTANTPALPSIAAPVTAIAAPVTAPLATTVAVAAPAAIAAPVAAPVVTTANQSLTAVGSILSSAAPPAAPPASVPNNPILATLAAALGKHCC